MMMRSMPSNRLSLTWMEIKAINLSPKMPEKFSMTLIKQKITKSTTMSYKQVQQQKRKVKNARGFRPKVSSSAGSGMRRDLQQLKAVTKCKNCGEMGHWHRECPRKNQSQSSSNSTNATADQPSSHSWWSLVQTAESADVQSMVGSSQHVSADGHHSSVE